MNRNGSWSFNPEEEGATADTINGETSLESVYNRAFQGWNGSGRIGTVPVLWDKKNATIVNNESREIIRMFDSFRRSGFGNGVSLCPEDLLDEIDSMIDANYESVNNGVYKSGFARTQGAYDVAVNALFDRIDELDQHLGERLVGPEKAKLRRLMFAYSPRSFVLQYSENYRLPKFNQIFTQDDGTSWREETCLEPHQIALLLVPSKHQTASFRRSMRRSTF